MKRTEKSKRKIKIREDCAKNDEEIKKETKAVRNDEELENVKEKDVLDVAEEKDIVNNEKELQKKIKKGIIGKNILLGGLCGKIIRVFVNRNFLLHSFLCFFLPFHSHFQTTYS